MRIAERITDSCCGVIFEYMFAGMCVHVLTLKEEFEEKKMFIFDEHAGAENFVKG